jgi:hypothetical protein
MFSGPTESKSSEEAMSCPASSWRAVGLWAAVAWTAVAQAADIIVWAQDGNSLASIRSMPR